MFVGERFSMFATLLAGMLASATGVSRSLITEERCSSETLKLRCPTTTGSDVIGRRDHVIAVKHVWYGRMRPAKRCISGVYAESLGCRADVTAYLHSVCSGRVNCTLLVATMDSVIQPCPKDFKSYLEITYECIRVSFIDDCVTSSMTSQQVNSSSSGVIRLTEDTGHLALYRGTDISGSDQRVSRSGRPESGSQSSASSCYWSVEAPVGRKIVVSWKIALGGWTPVSSQSSKRADKHDACPTAVVFRDGSDRRETLVRTSCSHPSSSSSSSSHPVSHRGRAPVAAGALYHSTTNRLQVHATWSGHNQPAVPEERWTPYILEYTFVGCEDIKPPSRDARVSRHGDVTTIVCSDQSRETWQVTCRDNAWSGEIGNCSSMSSVDDERRLKPIKPFPTHVDITTGVAVAVLVGIVLGVVVGSFLMLVVFVVKHRGQSEVKDADADYHQEMHNHHAITHHRLYCETAATPRDDIPAYNAPVTSHRAWSPPEVASEHAHEHRRC